MEEEVRAAHPLIGAKALAYRAFFENTCLGDLSLAVGRRCFVNIHLQIGTEFSDEVIEWQGV